MKQLKMFFNGNDWIAANDLPHAVRLWNDMTGENWLDDYESLDDWDSFDDDTVIEFWYEDLPNKFPDGSIVIEKDGLYGVQAEAGVWARWADKPGFVASFE